MPIWLNNKSSIAVFAIALAIIGANHINHLNQNDIPSEITEFAKRYPEAIRNLVSPVGK